MIVEMRVDIIEDEITGQTVDWTLVDEKGRVVFRFGLVGPSTQGAEDPTFGLTPDFFGLKLGDRVCMVMGDD